MRMRHCPNCNHNIGHARQLGVGTLLACCVTGGLWVFAIPFYSLRCIACGNPTPHPPLTQNQWIALGVAAAIWAVLIVWGGLRDAQREHEQEAELRKAASTTCLRPDGTPSLVFCDKDGRYNGPRQNKTSKSISRKDIPYASRKEW